MQQLDMSPIRDRADAPEQEVQERLERGHQVSVLCLKLEQYLLNNPAPQWEEFLAATPELLMATQPRRENMQKMMEMVSQRNEQSAELVDALNLNEKTPEAAAREIFKRRTEGKQPVGSVEMKVEGGYIIFYCPNQTDYDLMMGESGLENSGGTAHRAMEMNVSVQTETATIRYVPAVLLIKEKRDSTDQSGIVAHERQHFIFRQLYAEEILTEPTTGKELWKDSLKDELLAFLRGKQDVDRILTSGLYDDKFTALGSKYKQLVSDIASIQATMPSWLKKAGSGLIVYQLMLAKVESFPRLLTKLVNFYSDNMDLVRSAPLTPDEKRYIPPPFPRMTPPPLSGPPLQQVSA